MSGVRRAGWSGWGEESLGRVAWGLGCVGIAAQISYPLTEATLRDLVTVAVVLLLAGACVAHAAATRGTPWAAGLVLVTVGGGLLVEFVGTTTGLPFGDYVYTAAGALGPELGTVPLLIGPAWTFGTYPAWCAAQALVGPERAVATVLVAGWALASWDLYLDPQMVADGRWRWLDPHPALPGVPEVPLSNYAGWLLVALAFALALHALDRVLTTGALGDGAPDDGAPHHDSLPLVLFCWTWLGSALAHAVLLDLPASAAYGLVGMGLVGAPLLVTLLLSGGRVPRPTSRPPSPRVGR